MGMTGRLREHGAPAWVYRGYLTVVMTATVVLPFALGGVGHVPARGTDLVTGLVLVAVSVLNLELGRIAEGGVAGSQRPHKALSAWAFAAALLLPTWWLLPVVAVTYAHAWWRGLRVPILKWIGSGAYLVLCGLAAAATSTAIAGREMDLLNDAGAPGLIVVVASGAAFLAVETVLFHASAYLNRPESEVWLRQTLSSASFYLTEAAVLSMGGLSALLWIEAPWALVLLIPVFALTQRAALHEPLRERAEHDDKTGLLRFEAWRRLVALESDRRLRQHEAWGLLFVDIDHFKLFNDRWGHLVGDEALIGVARCIEKESGADAIVGRFGGEEFCVFVAGTERGVAEAGERIRVAVSRIEEPGTEGLTVSVGLAVVRPGQQVELHTVLEQADRALYAAKQGGRNATSLSLVGETA
ncbi:GGDEF domain-containing protein [Nocardioides nematodiphilus]|uniref:GGDEF domain-containing protein n=1 Tax=Nocardioides nematodiphilus TaxID=2849669 RepID=UPI001CD9A9C5|nr:GGDEF domain-containing protein [Nocardioides nematodiphilus]MCA1982125.1 GGDEF domain-containing protein [Nocardioides nematodiphilus]